MQAPSEISVGEAARFLLMRDANSVPYSPTAE